MQVLAGDIGGTNSRLLCVDIANDSRQIIAEKNYASADFDGLLEVIDHFMLNHGISTTIDAACFAIAGPVESGVAKVTNLPWKISEQQLTDVLHASKVKLINDLAAAAYGISMLDGSDMLQLQQGQEKTDKSGCVDAVVVAAGTGLGAAHRVCLNNHYQVFSSETGHTGFAPENIEQTELLAWLQKKNSHVSLEMLLSGKGLFTIYDFLRENSTLPETADIKKALQKTNPAQVITEHALSASDELCVKALEMFIDIYGAAAGDIVLQHYPVSELYIAGGIAPKIKEKMLEPRFIDAFVNKGLMTANMKKLTVKLVLQEKTGLFGALYLAQSSLS